MRAAEAALARPGDATPRAPAPPALNAARGAGEGGGGEWGEERGLGAREEAKEMRTKAGAGPGMELDAESNIVHHVRPAETIQGLSLKVPSASPLRAPRSVCLRAAARGARGAA
jgi:hypothetical protein